MNTEDKPVEKLTVLGLLRFFLFDAQAIRTVAASRGAFWLGLLFVVAAGFAREYDGEYLVAESWHLVLPLAASLIGCFSMVVLIFIFLKAQKAEAATFFETFRSFLNVYWMTAPMALLYGIPFERMFDPAGATQANLWLLGFVAAWRVLLMIRCTQVLCGTSVLCAILPVMLFSDVLALLALNLVPGPIFMIMGGVRLSESESLILSLRIWLGLLGFFTMAVWVIGYLVVLCNKMPVKFYRANQNWSRVNPRVAGALWLVAAVSILMWFPMLPGTQAEQSLRYQAESLIEQGEFVALSKLTSENSANRFPPHWDPPPRVGYGEREPEPLDVLAGLLANDKDNWLVEVYSKKLAFRLGLRPPRIANGTMPDEEVEKLVDVLERLPDGKLIAERVYSQQWFGEDADISAERRALIEQLRVLADVEEDQVEDDGPFPFHSQQNSND